MIDTITTPEFLDGLPELRVGTPGVLVFQIRRDAETGSPKAFPFIYPTAGNTLDFTYSFEKDKFGLSVRVIDTDNTFFRHFFSSNSVFSRIAKLTKDPSDTFENGINALVYSLFPSTSGKTSGDILVNGDETRSKLKEILNLVDQKYWSASTGAMDLAIRLTRAEFDINAQQAESRLRGEAQENRDKLQKLSDSLLSKVDSIYSDAKSFYAQISDGTNVSEHLDLRLTKLKLYTSASNQLMIDLFFTSGSDTSIRPVGGYKSSRITPGVNSGEVGVVSYSTAPIPDFRAPAVPIMQGGLASLNPSTPVQALSYTKYEYSDRLKDRLLAVIETAISSWLYESDNALSVANVICILNRSLGPQISKLVEDAYLFFEESAQTQRKEDKIALRIEAVRETLKHLGFRVTTRSKDVRTHRGYDKIFSDMYISVDPYKMKDYMESNNGDPRLAIKSFVNDLIISVGGYASCEIEPISTYLYKDLIIRSITKDKTGDEILNPLYNAVDDSYEFPVENDNPYLKVKGEQFYRKPLLLITDNIVQQRMKIAKDVLDYDTNTGEGIIKSNYDALVSSDIWRNRFEDKPSTFTLPLFLYNEKGANVTDFTVLAEDYATGLFKMKPPAFIQKVFLNTGAAAAGANYTSDYNLYTDAEENLKAILKLAEDPSVAEQDFLFNYEEDEQPELLGRLEVLTSQVQKIGNELKNVPDLEKLLSSDGEAAKQFRAFLEQTIMTDYGVHKTLEIIDPKDGSKKVGVTALLGNIINEFIYYYSDKNISITGFLEFLDFYMELQRFTHTLSVRTIPMFHLSNQETIGNSCVFRGKVPASPNDFFSQLRYGGFLKDLVFNGAYKIVGFKHVVTGSDAYSEFKLLKPKLTDNTETVVLPVVNRKEEEYEQELTNNAIQNMYGGGD